MATRKTSKTATKPKLSPADRKKLEIALARKELPAFVEYVLRDKDGKRVRNAPHQIAWWEHLMYSIKIRKIPLILAPMSYAKTQWMAVALPLWLLGQNENFRILMVSSAEKNASERIEEVGRYIQYSAAYREVFPWVRPDYSRDWNKNRINIKRRGLVPGDFASSVNSSLSAFGYTSQEGNGARCDILIYDDVVSEKNSFVSEARRAELKSLVESQWHTRPDPVELYDRWGNFISDKPLKLAIGTRYHEEDLYAHWLNTPTAYCSLVQGVSDSFDYLDAKIVGALADPAHPVYEKYRDWRHAA